MKRLHDLIQDEATTYKGTWMPVRYEPIAGSGESYTVAIAAYSDTDTDHRVIKTISDKMLKCLFNNIHATEMHDQINWVLETLETASEEHNLQEWQSPLANFTHGNIQTTFDEDMLGIINQAIRQSTALSPLLDTLKQPEHQSKHRWGVKVRQSLLQANPDLRPYIARKVPYKNGNSTMLIDFFDDYYCANLANIGSTLSTDSALAKVLKLDTLVNQAEKPIEAEIILHTFAQPNDLDLSVKKAQKLQDAKQMIIDQVQARPHLKIIEIQSDQKTTQHILQKAKTA
ncbi:hypothetical protein [Thiomicrorhabdus lithotrophica]|uniref:Uncharacterized protein n=1 Tax=Thiomicrorhabdus lithotrophica TaxID=2949997 RepID=A0ABY8CCA0_9GAMM|nr:hypothetical protein [Thiomicrorhabdus lithotrophica]WEJ62176.1 hypothetical protein NR989_09160 [Thiomicrorhabdus lithotrophica]